MSKNQFKPLEISPTTLLLDSYMVFTYIYITGREKQDELRSCRCQRIDNINRESDTGAINTLGTQGCILVCFKS